MKEGLIKDAYEAMIKELQTILTIAYIFSVAIGMLFTYHKYKEFNINIFDYADILDFLIAPFSDFAILYFIIGSSILLGLLILGDTYSKRNYPRAYSRFNFALIRNLGLTSTDSSPLWAYLLFTWFYLPRHMEDTLKSRC